MKFVKTIKAAAEIADLHRHTAVKYLKTGELPSDLQKSRKPTVQPTAIQEEHWEDLKSILEDSPELEATAALIYLQEKYEGCYNGKEVRSLQRRMKDWRVFNGKTKAVMFSQIYRPGERSQSDFINMNYLKVTIRGQQYDHLLFHFMLPYSGWEYSSPCEGGESFRNLREGYETALWLLGGVTTEHRTDNLTAAITVTKKGKVFTENWAKLMVHYKVEPTTNNAGKSNENGKVERSNGMLKRSLENHLYLRKSRDFDTVAEYKTFISNIVSKRNKQREIKVSEEKLKLQELPSNKWYSAIKLPVKVHTDSTIRVEGGVYSVPSRTIGATLFAYIYPDKIDLYYGSRLVEKITRHTAKEVNINFIHVIESLKRKPGAFEDYKYKEYMFPTKAFRRTYDKLKQQHSGTKLNKLYIELLHLAKIFDLKSVSKILHTLLESEIVPTVTRVRMSLETKIPIPELYIIQPNLSDYDELIEVAECKMN
jgi:hypothetical protein